MCRSTLSTRSCVCLCTVIRFRVNETSGVGACVCVYVCQHDKLDRDFKFHNFMNCIVFDFGYVECVYEYVCVCIGIGKTRRVSGVRLYVFFIVLVCDSIALHHRYQPIHTNREKERQFVWCLIPFIHSFGWNLCNTLTHTNTCWHCLSS